MMNENELNQTGLSHSSQEALHGLLDIFNAENAFKQLDDYVTILTPNPAFQKELTAAREVLSEKNELFLEYIISKDEKRKKEIVEKYDRLKDRAYEAILFAPRAYEARCELELNGLTCKHLSFSVEQFSESLADVMADIAMLELEEGLSHKEKMEKMSLLQTKLNELREDIFATTVMGPNVPTDTYADYKKLLDLSSVDVLTKQVLVSGLMLSCLKWFDYGKWQSLLYAYRTSQDFDLKQRALVGLMLVVPFVHPYYDERVKADLRKLYDEDKTFRRDLLMVSKLIVRTKHYEEDSHKMGKFLVKGLFHATSSMLKERLGDSDYDLSDDDDSIFHLDEEDEETAKEDMMDAAGQMYDMIENGADLYYGQFRKKKNKKFFKSMFNWFMPIYMEHPMVLDIRAKVDESFDKNFSLLLSSSTMCSCDCFSFLHTLPKDPKELEQLLKQMTPPSEWGNEGDDEMDGEELDDAEMDEEGIGEEQDDAGQNEPEMVPFKETTDPQRAAFRATVFCLQDLYRFFNLAPMRDFFQSPFDLIEFSSSVSPLMSFAFKDPVYDKVKLAVARFCVKHEEYQAIVDLLENMDCDTEEYRYMMAMGYGFSDEPQYDKALGYAERLLQARPDNIKFIGLMAELCFEAKKPEKALPLLEVLMENSKDNPKKADELLVFKAMLLEQKGDYDGAVKCSYQLVYEHPHEDRFVVMLATYLVSRNPTDRETMEKVKKLLNDLLDHKSNMMKLPDLKDLKDLDASQAMGALMNMMSTMMSVDHTFDDKIFALVAYAFWVTDGLQGAMEHFFRMIEVKLGMNGEKTSTALDSFDLLDYFEEDWVWANGYSETEVEIISECLRYQYNAYLVTKRERQQKEAEEMKKTLDKLKNSDSDSNPDSDSEK